VQGARPPVPEPLGVRPRARLREVAAGPSRQEVLHRRRGLFRQKALKQFLSRSTIIQLWPTPLKLQRLAMQENHLGDLARHVMSLLAPCVSGRSSRRHGDEEDVQKHEQTHRRLALSWLCSRLVCCNRTLPVSCLNHFLCCSPIYTSAHS
jgi:hypothetical protein